ncbi:drug/metabolite transporter (DMT)-like permease [Chitinivorax tropicus]|uniref:Drug/metabolite transporter (DMT)-like permease n=1 Tax=Chitinivorax tropicus TaxID=714531 RepID=A0A840MIC7_9PROT|nr:DMT family transporter [Chitinivorax tropicus]MBB5016949.1 drug/metabolite transporter (DMT)-like permease [Chitinivorax tropicus]
MRLDRANQLALAAILLWASLASLGVKLAQVPPFMLVGISLLVGSLGSIHRIGSWRVPLGTLVVGVAGLFGYHFCLFLALRWAAPVQVNLLNYLWPLLLVVLSPVVLTGYRLSLPQVGGGVLGFTGAALLVTGGGQVATPMADWAGYGLAMLAALIWAVYSLLTKRLPAFPTSAIGGFAAVSGLLSLICHVLLEPAYSPSAEQWALLLLLGAGPLGAAFFLWDAALKKGDPRVIGTLAYLTPLLSTALLVVTGGAALSWPALVALGLILSGAWLGSRPARERVPA